MAEEPKFIILVGPPGGGKGTQASLLLEALDVPHVSSGDLFREHFKNNTELGRRAKEYNDRGELVPDDITIAMVMERLQRPDCAGGALLDGFPRTMPQAEALDGALAERGLRVSAVPYIAVPDDVLVERLSGRWICKTCGESYHTLFNPPGVAGVCDRDGGELYQRDDDKPGTVKNRLKVFYDLTEPLIEYYRDKSVLKEVNGNQDIEEVQAELRAALGLA